MRFKNGLMVSAALCAITAGDGEPVGGAGAAPASESVLEQAKDEVVAFIGRVETDLLADARDAGSWLLDELKKLEPIALSDLKSAVQQAATDAAANGSTGSMVTDALNVLYRDFADIAGTVKSDVLTAVVGLTTASPAP